MANTLSYPPRSNWSISTRDRGNNLYILALVFTKEFTKTSRFLPFTDFIFNVNPKSRTLEEPVAVNITPTQDGGQFIEHQGQIYKNISITGTTGLRPNKGPGAVIPVLNIENPFAAVDIDPDTGLPRGETTGFDDFFRLRNLFRTYFDYKVDPDFAPITLMLWQNGKEGEYYIVEPISFKTSADSGSPVTLSYDIQLRTIARYEDDKRRIASTSDPIGGLQEILNAPARIRKTVRFVDNAINAAESLVKRTSSMGASVVDDILIPMHNIMKKIANVVGTPGGTIISRQDLVNIALASITTKAILDSSKANEVYKTKGFLTPLALQSNAYKNIFRGCHNLLGEDTLFSSHLSATMARSSKAYTNPITGIPSSGGSPSDLNNVASGGAAAVAKVNMNEDIFMLSQRLLGDRARYKEIIILNNLRSPYIRTTSSQGVLKPGDDVLYPVAGSSQSATISKRSTLNAVDNTLGVDLLLESTQKSAGITVFDLSVDTTGDLARINGPSNLGQAIDIKVNTEQGELPTHPIFGGLFPIGTKAKQKSLIQFSVNLRATLLTDRRISDIQSLNVTANGNVINVKSTLIAKGAQQPLTTNLSMRGN